MNLPPLPLLPDHAMEEMNPYLDLGPMDPHGGKTILYWHTPDQLRAYAEQYGRLCAEAEREACAKLCDVTPPYPFRPSIEAAHAIRARSTR